MKKLRFIVILFLITALTILSAACEGGTLATPVGFQLDENDILTWESVQDARNYAIEIKNVSGGHSKDDATRLPRYSLMTLEEGDYEIRVRAVGGEDYNVYSPWSAVLQFHKDPTTGMQFSLINNATEYEITRVGTAEGDVVIGDLYRNKPITRIGSNAFRSNAAVTSVTFGSNIREVADTAFFNCGSIERVVMTDAVTTLGVSAFQGCRALKDVTLSENITQIPGKAFAYCRSLEKIELGSKVETIGESAFSNCEALTDINIPDSVTQIDEYAFTADVSLANVELGSGVSRIGQHAFDGLEKLTSLSFKREGKLTIDNYAFANCTSLERVTLPEGLEVVPQALFYNCEKLNDVTIPGSVKEVMEFAFLGTECYNEQTEGGNGFIYVGNWLVNVLTETKAALQFLTPDMFREGTIGIADSAFTGTTSGGTAVTGCPILEQVELPASIKYVGDTAFYASPALNKFISPEGGVETVGAYALAYSPVLSNVQFGRGLKKIGNGAFYGCSMLNNNIYFPDALIPDTVEKIGTSAFGATGLWNSPDEYGVIYAGNWVVGSTEDCSGLIELRSEVQGIGNYAFMNRTNLETVTGLNRADHIGAGAFYGCAALGQISLSRNLREIEDYTFLQCASLFSVSFPTRLSSIGNFAFYGCERLNAIDLSPAAVEKIGNYAFYGCYNVKSLNLGEAVTQIGSAAFYKCAQVTELEIPASVTRIGSFAFGKCNYLQKVNFHEGLEQIGNYAFLNTRIYNIDLPDSLTYIGDFAFYKNVKTRTIHFGANLQHIGRYAFYGMSRVQQIFLPASVTYIGDFAFKGCSSLSSVILTNNVEYIGEHAFYGCRSLTFYGTSENEDGAGRWSTSWNSSARPVIWSSVLSDDGTYVVSIQTGAVSDPFVLFGKISAPVREGYEFIGWAESPDAEYPEYAAWELKDLPAGRTLYAVWAESQAEPDPEPDIIDPPPGYNPNMA